MISLHPALLRHPAVVLQVVTALLIGCLSFRAAAIDPAVPLDRLTRSTWGHVERVPVYIQDLAQTDDGFIWLAALGGLTRFDGVTFDPVTETQDGPLPRDRIEQMNAGPDGGLWVWYADGKVLRIRSGRAQAMAVLPTDAGRSRAMAFSPQGRLWVATINGVFELDGERWREASLEPGLEGRAFDDLLFDSDGALWVLSDAGLFVRRRGTPGFERVLQRQTPTVLTGLAEARDGGVWMFTSTGDENLCRIRRSSPKRCWRALGILRPQMDRHGALWWTAAGSLRRLAQPDSLPDGLDSVEPVTERLEGNWEHMMHARDGSFWGAMRQGLVQLRGSPVRKARTPTGAIVAGEAGDIFLASFTRGLMRLGTPAADAALSNGKDGTLWSASAAEQGSAIKDGMTFEPFKRARAADEPAVLQRYPEAGVTAVRLDRGPKGEIYMGTLAPPGLVRLSRERIEKIELPELGRGAVIRGAAIDSKGAIWFGAIRTPVALYRREGTAWEAYGGASDAAAVPVVSSVAIDSQDRTWISMGIDAVGVVEGATLRTFSAADGLDIGHAFAVHVREPQVWVTGERGVALFANGRFRMLVGTGGQAFTGCSGIEQLASGDLWLNCVGGLFRVQRSEWARTVDEPSYRVTTRRFDHHEGVLEEPIPGGPLPSLAQGTDGRIWFSTRDALYWIDPNGLGAARPAPPVVVQRIVADEVTYRMHGDVSLPPRTDRIQFSFLAPDAEAPLRTRFRYRLRGVDANWTDAGTRREISYNGLRPGAHELEVVASDKDGRWGESSAVVKFYLQPAYFQTAWFYALCTMLAGFLFWGAYRLRIRQLAERFRLRSEARVQERERIARELHDTLLQSTHGLMLSVQALADRIPADHPDKARIERVLERADQAVNEGRRRVLDLRAGATDSDLADLLEACAAELNERGPAVVRVQVEGARRPVMAKVRDEVLSLGQEALLNAQRHAQASKIDLIVAYTSDELSLCISDNGVGMDVGLMEGRQVRPGHFGLTGLRERAAGIGASLSIRAGTRGGTVVELRVPAARAYG